MADHLTIVLKPMIVNMVNELTSRPGPSSESFSMQGSQAAMGYVPSTSSAQLSNVGNFGQAIPQPVVRILQRPKVLDGHNQSNPNLVNLANMVNQSGPIPNNSTGNNDDGMANQNKTLPNVENERPVIPAPNGDNVRPFGIAMPPAVGAVNPLNPLNIGVAIPPNLYQSQSPMDNLARPPSLPRGPNWSSPTDARPQKENYWENFLCCFDNDKDNQRPLIYVLTK